MCGPESPLLLLPLLEWLVVVFSLLALVPVLTRCQIFGPGMGSVGSVVISWLALLNL